MKKFLLVIGVLFSFIIVMIMGSLLYYKNGIGPVSDSTEQVLFTVNKGDTYYSICSELKDKGLIKSENAYKIYLKINAPDKDLKVGEYNLSPNMDVNKIINTLSGKAISKDISITFQEGKNMRYIAKIIAQNTNNTEEDVYNLLKDKEYLNSLIKEYWFIDKSILNDNIYYSLEGYLYPDTYNFISNDVTVEQIFKTLLDETKKKIEPYKDSILKSKYSYHELLTIASVVELEAKSDEDRNLVAAVFYNRLNAHMSLGSDVTTYYAAKVDMSERDLYIEEINSVNSYNTRSDSMVGKIPIGPICNPSISSIKAAINPAKNDYYFFVADKNGKVYFTKTNAEHNQIITKLKKEGLWYTY